METLCKYIYSFFGPLIKISASKEYTYHIWPRVRFSENCFLSDTHTNY